MFFTVHELLTLGLGGGLRSIFVFGIKIENKLVGFVQGEQNVIVPPS